MITNKILLEIKESLECPYCWSKDMYVLENSDRFRCSHCKDEFSVKFRCSHCKDEFSVKRGAIFDKRIGILLDDVTPKDLIKDNNYNVKPEAFANIFLKTASDFNIYNIDHLKLQKLLYYAYLVLIWGRKSIAFHPKHISFWKFGPVVYEVYSAFQVCGKENLFSFFDNRLDKMMIKETTEGDTDRELTVKPFDVEDKDIRKNIETACKYTLIALGNKNAMQLVDMTHEEFSAWKKHHSDDENRRTSKKQPTEEGFINRLDDMIKEVTQHGFFEDDYKRNSRFYI